jgi:ornithine--oxo-acid transaminase
MRAGFATLDVLEIEHLGRRAIEMGSELRRRLQETLSGYEMIKDIRGLGLLSGIEFQAPSKISLRVPFEAFQRIHPGLFGQMVVMRMFRDERILTQICGNNFMVLKAAPPLIVDESQIQQFVGAAGRVVELIHSSSMFWSDALALARRALNI